MDSEELLYRKLGEQIGKRVSLQVLGMPDGEQIVGILEDFSYETLLLRIDNTSGVYTMVQTDAILSVTYIEGGINGSRNGH